ncbi:early nodulin-like protein 5 [Miscanthus floridulus]|uniref:early nodulin-like protein 5 n=1 Tax=Miscanthus floridulus TaxID=154761 RepID=UPI0034588BEB
MAVAAGSSRDLPALMILTGVFFLLVAPGGVAAEAAAAPPAGLEFRVGGPRGWRVPDANTSYDWWAMNNRFHVGDHLYFKYANDSVLVVDRLAFDACNASEPLAAFADGATKFRLDRPGFFCFISGEPGHCEEGQRLIVRVMVHPALAAAPGPAASAPGAPTQLGHGGGGDGRPGPSGCSCSDASSGVGAAIAAAAGVAIAAAMATVVSLVLMLQ